MSHQKEGTEVPKHPRASYIKCSCGCRASLSIVNEAGDLDLTIVKQHATMIARAKMYEKYGDEESHWPSFREMIMEGLTVAKAMPKMPEPLTTPLPPPEPMKPARKSGRDLF